MVFERPSRPGQSRPNPTVRPNSTERPIQSTTAGTGKTKKVLPDIKGSGGNRGGSGGGGNGGNSNNPPPETSPWLNPAQAPEEIHASSSFVEYLRWMRSPDSVYRDPTKVQILQMAVEGADYRKRLESLNQRTKLMAGIGNWFLVESVWRIRVGGHKGPESILLPAFDALGMPYIPGATLRGVARNQAIREFLASDSSLDWKAAEKKVTPYFGALEAEGSDRSGKVVFLDAYPTPSKAGGLAMDMANAIWSWENGEPKYSPNPNPFLSLEKSTFIIGLRKKAACTDEILAKVRHWLEIGLADGIGSQVNTGYGRLIPENVARSHGFFELDFTIAGQLIHGHQRFTQWTFNGKQQKWQMRGSPQAEVRPTAFKSMLRYWFRAISLGVLSVEMVKKFEAKLFGSITPQTHGWITVEIFKGNTIRPEPQSKEDRNGKKTPNGEQSGTLVLGYSTEISEHQHEIVADLLKYLTWLMFHLGGIGQGARRPLYSRQNQERERFAPPWWRGCDLIAESEDEFWALPKSVNEFQVLFQQRLRSFYQALGHLTQARINHQYALEPVRQDLWHEVIDRYCEIIVCSGVEDFGKPYALSILHDDDLKIEIPDKNDKDKKVEVYDGYLCGEVKGNHVKPSPVWIANLGNYQVVTVFGATQNPRKKYLKQLRDRTSATSFAQIFPLE
ncbi:CRISPR-associated protein Cmr6 [Neosynechococcus sphagnicola sy1]|uniref:CRISPR-associated protein Cmr6 n=1 Tax=Neosynechococcus sphagnicola sy1 TaxID=1497020 RepID=A0A098TKF7_9CYAN|nr:RAMP superfamily CRISPR-associated protein [Neosynechococcus sphagnicola]KGF72820.1 CRISPR-associated protein Cmr6 [Neosynechococcus sphagnicola sy1]